MTREIILKDGLKENYNIDHNPRAHLAEVRKDGKIWVNSKFDNLLEEEKLAIIYHERGHSNFIIFKQVKFVQELLLPLSLLSLIIAITCFLFTNNVSSEAIRYMAGVVFLIDSVLLFTSYLFLYWLLEVIADSNSVKKVNKKILIKVVGDLYTKKKIGLWRRNIEHPPWNLRKKIIEKLD